MIGNILIVNENTNHVYRVDCVFPDPCPGCGQCRLCDAKCTCTPA